MNLLGLMNGHGFGRHKRCGGAMRDLLKVALRGRYAGAGARARGTSPSSTPGRPRSANPRAMRAPISPAPHTKSCGIATT